jgi:hypothetical protein
MVELINRLGGDTQDVDHHEAEAVNKAQNRSL